MVGAITVIFCCQLAGELIVAATKMPVPGPVIGMAILLLGLIVRGGVPEGIAAAGDALLRNLALLFVPAGVGVMLHIALIGREALAISVALVASTLVTIAVTALSMQAFQRLEKGTAGKAGGKGDRGA